MAPISTLNTDLDFILQDAGVAVVYGSQHGFGKFRNEPITIIDDGGLTQLQGDATLIVRNGAFTGLAFDAAITVDGTTYHIRRVPVPLPDNTIHLALV